MRRHAGALLACAALAACDAHLPVAPPAGPAAVPATTPAPAPAVAAPADAAAALEGGWFSPPAEYPGICMTLAPGGKLDFAGGFTFFNPGRWSYDAAAAELQIELGGNTPLSPELLKPAKPGAGAPLRVDAARRALVYSVTPATDMVDVGGFVFYRKQACQ